MSGGCADKQTVQSFLQLFRMLTLYYPAKENLRGMNCDGEERAVLLTNYTGWMKHQFTKSKNKLKE